MKIIGLTGGIACGKTTISDMLYDLGAKVIDADGISHDLTRPGGDGLPPIREAFGSYVFYPDGTLNRNTLSDLVFRDTEARARLNSALHPLIIERIKAGIESCRKMGALIVVLDVPLLFETGLQELADVVLCASAPLEKQLERMKSRDGLSPEQGRRRIESQMPLEEKEKRSDVVIYTDKPEDELRAEVRKLYDAWVQATDESGKESK